MSHTYCKQGTGISNNIPFPHKLISTTVVSTWKECWEQCDLFSLRPPPSHPHNKYETYGTMYEYICTYIHTYIQTPLAFNTLMWGSLRLAPITPPIDPTPNLFSNSNIHSTVNAHSNSCTNQKAGLLTKQNLGGEWSRPFCSRPWVSSSKGPKPVVMQWRERVLPWRPVCFWAYFPKNSNSLCHNCPTRGVCWHGGWCHLRKIGSI